MTHEWGRQIDDRSLGGRGRTRTGRGLPCFVLQCGRLERARAGNPESTCTCTSSLVPATFCIMEVGWDQTFVQNTVSICMFIQSWTGIRASDQRELDAGFWQPSPRSHLLVQLCTENDRFESSRVLV